MKYLKRAWFILLTILAFLPFALYRTWLGVLEIASGEFDDSPWNPLG